MNRRYGHWRSMASTVVDVLDQLCIRANSVRRALELLEIIDEKYGEELNYSFATTKAFLARTCRLFVMMIVYWVRLLGRFEGALCSFRWQMNIKMHEEMLYYIKKKKVDGAKITDTADLIFYMDNQLGIIARCLKYVCRGLLLDGRSESLAVRNCLAMSCCRACGRRHYLYARA